VSKGTRLSPDILGRIKVRVHHDSKYLNGHAWRFLTSLNVEVSDNAASDSDSAYLPMAANTAQAYLDVASATTDLSTRAFVGLAFTCNAKALGYLTAGSMSYA